MKVKAKDVEVAELPPCEVCAIEFTASKPNPATYEGPTPIGWANVCTGHKGRLSYVAIHYVVRPGA